jgi:hypothetical protein
MGSVRRGMCTGTKPTLMRSVTGLSNGSSSTPVGVSPDASAPRNGLPMPSSAKRNELLRRAAHGLDESPPAPAMATTMGLDPEAAFSDFQLTMIYSRDVWALTTGTGGAGGPDFNSYGLWVTWQGFRTLMCTHRPIFRFFCVSVGGFPCCSGLLSSDVSP